jgi:hypothetical protein
MRLGFIILGSLLLGALAAATFLDDTGYVLVQFQDWTLETSFAAGVGALLVLTTRQGAAPPDPWTLRDR